MSRTSPWWVKLSVAAVLVAVVAGLFVKSLAVSLVAVVVVAGGLAALIYARSMDLL